MLTIGQVILFWLIFDIPYLFYRILELMFPIKRKGPEEHPLVSIIVPAYNEDKCIYRTLKSCMQQSYRSIEIIVVDDGSTDNTIEVVRDFHSKNSPELKRRRISFKFVRQDNGGKARALNNGLKHAHGEFIVTIDADSYLSHKGIENIIRYFVAKDVGAVAGNVMAISKHKVLDYLQYLEYELGIVFLRSAQSFTHDVLVTPGAFSAYRRSALNYFEEGTLTEDFDTSVRIIEKDYKIVQAVDAVCYTQLPMDVHDLIVQRIRWQQGGLQVFAKHFEHKKRILSHLEMFFVFFFGFYGIFPRAISFVVIPSMLLSGGYSVLTVILVFFLYSACILFIQFVMLYRYLKDKRMFAAIPAYIIYNNTLILYSCVMAQVLLFKKEVRWSKLSRYRM